MPCIIITEMLLELKLFNKMLYVLHPYAKIRWYIWLRTYDSLVQSTVSKLWSFGRKVTSRSHLPGTY